MTMRRIKVLVAGASAVAVEDVTAIIDRNQRCETETLVFSNGHVNPLQGVQNLPDILVLQYKQGSGAFEYLAGLDPSQRIPLIAFGPADDAEAVRLAMRARARDYLPVPFAEDEISQIISTVAEELVTREAREKGSVQVFVNGKGGSGASFLATNVAHGLASAGHGVTLVDMDLQFAGLCRYLDLEPEHGLFEALQAVDDMDAVSAEAFTCVHESGLRLLSAKSDQLRLNVSVEPEALLSLIETYRSFNDYVIIDLPRYIDALSATLLGTADRVAVVMQQTLPHIHDSARLLQILRGEIGISNSHISVVVNRYLRDSIIESNDIRKALGVDDLVKIPNQYKLTAESINSGLPLSDLSAGGSVAKGLRSLHHMIDGTVEEPEQSFLSKALPALLRR
jgi:pilus assembly protein CpaE